VRGEHGELIDKSDPVGFAAELPPRTASIVTDLTKHQWQDNGWMERRQHTNWLEKPISVYEFHLGSWKRDLEPHNGWIDIARWHTSWSRIARRCITRILSCCRQRASLHGSWGYQRSATSPPPVAMARPKTSCISWITATTHNIGVILDWVPAHKSQGRPRLRGSDGSALYEHADPRQGEHPDWGTMIFNYGRTEVRNFLLSNALFWLDKYHIDGLRVDAVASDAVPRPTAARLASGCPTNTADARTSRHRPARDFNREGAHGRHPGVY